MGQWVDLDILHKFYPIFKSREELRGHLSELKQGGAPLPAAGRAGAACMNKSLAGSPDSLVAHARGRVGQVLRVRPGRLLGCMQVCS
jgi:hypothetical protein